MKVSVECVYCYLKQVISTMKMAGIDDNKQHEILYILMDGIKMYSRDETPAYNSTEILLETYRLIENDDPYKEAKRVSNDLALEEYARLENELENSSDSLYNSLKFAAAGNVIDLGINISYDIDEALHHVVSEGFTIDHFNKFKKQLEEVKKVMILGDNSGEIVFDKLLVKELLKLSKDVVYVVKEKPILNDATIEDAQYVGMDKLCRVITNGSRHLGTCLKKVSADFLNEINEAELVIAKGQANYESLEGIDSFREKLFFLLRLKCEEVAKSAGGKYLDMVFMKR